ncbi:MAG: hypothetical protein Q9226_001159 [Calogaya cf. arnoldii]
MPFGTALLTHAIAVKSYVGFFALLWFNWLQITLYIVRSGVESVFEQVRGHSKVVAPLLIHMAVFATGAVICLGLMFSFNDYTHTLSYIAWHLSPRFIAKCKEIINYPSGKLGNIYYSCSNTTVIASALGTFATDIYNDFGSGATKYNVTSFYDGLAASSDANSAVARYASSNVFAALETAALKYFHNEGAEAAVKTSASYKAGVRKDLFDNSAYVAHAYNLIYV